MASVPSKSGDSDFPATWRWEEDGDELEGTFVEIDEGPTRFGDKPIVVIEVGSHRRTLWLLETALRSQFADELAKRPSGNFTVGERIVVRRGEIRESAAGHTYRAFQTRFPDRPKRDAAHILGTAAPFEPDEVAFDELDGESVPF